MKRKLGGILTAIIAITAVFCGAIFSPSKNQQSLASYKQGFDYIGPETELGGYDGKVTLGYNGNTEQYLRITVRDQYENIVHPVFSSDEMKLIATNKGAEVQYGFIELQPNHNVVVEVVNLTANRSTEYYLNHETQSRQVSDAATDDYTALFNTAYLYKNTFQRNSSDTSLVGVFNSGTAKANEGYLHFNIDTLVFDKTLKNLNLEFGFYIVDTSSYNVKPHLRHGDYEIDGTGDEYFNWTQNGGQFYYSYFDGAEPYIEYANKYFFVDIVESDLMKNLKRKFVITEEKNELTRKTFAYLGEYTVTAWKAYKDEKWKDDDGNTVGRWAYSHHNEHSFWLNVFGVQAYYENYNTENASYSSDRELFFGGETDQGADFSENATVKLIPTSTGFSTDGTGGTVNVASITNLLTPAVTNSPPVKLYSNVLSQSSSQTFYNNGNGWKLSKYNPSAQYQAAGEYFVVNYYTYSVANPTNRDFVYRQVFYFRIDNSVSVKVVGENNHTYYFLDEYVNRYAELTDGFAVFVHGLSNTEIGDYEVPASLTLTHYDWDGKSTNIPLVVEQNGRVTNLGEQTFEIDGKYVFEVRYGNRRVSSMDFTVIVDTKPAELIVTSEAKAEHQKRSELTDFAIFGDGEVTITIDAKKSGVGFSKYADIKFYPFEYNENHQQELEKTEINLYSKYSLGGKNHDDVTLIEPQPITSPIIATPTGWRFAETFTLGGIYQIKVEDDAGNISEFLFILENTPASFGQTVPPVKSQAGKMNIVDQPVSISFGEYKLIHALPKNINLDNVFTNAGFSEMYLNNAIYVQIVGREVSPDNFVYTPKTNLAQPGYSMDYTIDDLYFFRSIDALGNITPNYVWVNSDISQGMIIEDDIPIERNASPSDVAALVRPKGMSNRQSLHFSFITKRDLPAPHFRSDVVESVEVRYYPFAYDTNPVSNKNYPFASTYEESTIYDIGNNPDNSQEAPRDKIWATTDVRDTAVEAETVYIPINQRSGVTAEGLYVIERTYESLTFNNDVNVGDSINKTFFFVVDRNEVIPLNGVPFESDVEIRFDNGKVANWNHFKSPLKSDSVAVISVPFCPTTLLPSKYGSNLELGKIRYRNPGDPQPSDQTLTMNGLSLNVSLTKPNGTVVTDNNELYSSLINDGAYRLTIADQSGGISLGFFGQTGLLMQSSGSVSTIDFSLNIHRANVTWVRNNKALPSNVSSTQFVKGVESIGGDKLGIEFNNGPDYMHADVHKMEIYRNNQLVQTENIPYTPDINTFYYFDLTSHIKDCDEEIVAKLYYFSDEFGSDVYDFSVTLNIDNKSPTWNLRDKDESLQKADTHFNKLSTSNAPIISSNGNFVYAIDIDSNFAFQPKPENPHLDTYEFYHIQEVTSELLTNRLGFSKYERYSNIPFSSIINLQSNEQRYFRITETDQAGNEAIYYVRIKGSQYPVDVFPVLGLASGGNLLGASYYDENFEYVFGTNIRVGDFTAYWDANPTFVWSWKRTNDPSVGSEYRRVKNMVKTTVNSPTGTRTLVSDDSRSKFQEWVENMLDSNIGQQIELTVNNGFRARTLRISQANNTTAIIDATAQIDDSLKISVTNGFEIAQTFPGIRFYVSVFEIINGEVRTEITSENDFSITTNPKVIDEGAGKDYFIRVKDSFGREVTYEYYHNGVMGSIIYNGMIKVLYGTRYVGHEDGVTIQYDPRVLRLEINDQPFNGVSMDGRITQVTDPITGFITVHIKPDPKGDLSTWKVALRYLISGNIANSGSWQFYNHMPTLTFHNKNGELITDHVESGFVPGEVVAKLTRAGYLFPSTISYTVTLQDGTVLFEGVGRNTERIDLDYAGIYTITVTNTVSARKNYTFIITDVNNVDYRVLTIDNGVWVAVGQKEVSPGTYVDRWFNEAGLEVAEQDGVWKNGYYKNGTWRELQSSPETISYDTGSGVYGTVNIPVYYVVSNSNDDININSSIWKMRVVPSISNERTLHRVGQLGTQNAYVYYLLSPHSDSRIYFVIARVNPTSNFLSLVREAPSTTLTDIDWTIGSNFATYRSVASPGVKVSINATRQSNVLATNVYYADYHYNGEYAGRFYFYHSDKANEFFTFYAKDYGIYEFYLYDWAGNRQVFNGNNCFTIINLARPPVLINGETMVDEMLYNNLDLSFITIPSFVNQSDTAMFVTSIYVERDGEPVFPCDEDGNPLYPVKADSKIGYFFDGEKREGQYIKHMRTNFSLSDNGSGRYKIVIEYCNRINSGLTRQIVKSEFYVTYANNSQYMHTFNYGGTTGIDLISIFQGKTNITDRFKTLPIQLNAGGTYEITLRVNNSVKKAFEVTRTVELSQLQIGNASNLVRANKAFGGTHKGGVTITFNPRHVSMMFTDDEAVLTIFKDGQVIEKYHINSTDMLKENSEEGRVLVENVDISQTFSDQGVYEITLKTSNDVCVFYNGFVVGSGMNPVIIILLIVGVGIVIVAMIIFIKLRTGMRVR